MSTNDYLNQLKQALGTMYSNASADEKKLATNYLESFQKSKEAWEIVLSILGDTSISVEVRLFAAQTLRSKVTFDLHQLEESHYAQLKDSIINFITKHQGRDEKLIRTQLNIALSHVALQYLTWSNAVQEIITKFSSDMALVSNLLEFLKILPEELSDVKRTSLTDEEFNTRTNELIVSNVENVLLLLKNLAESNTNSQWNSAILDCLNSWIKECPVESILQINTLTSLIFQSLGDDVTFEKAVDCLCSIIRETRDIDNHELIEALYQQILQLNEFMHSHKDKLEDPDTLEGLTRLYVEAGESWHVLIAKNPKHFKPLVSILLECCKIQEDLDIVKYTFYFWYLLKQLITLPRFEASKVEFKDIYLELIEIVIRQLTYPTDNEDGNLFDGDREQEDKFKEFRYELGDVLKDCCAVAGPVNSLSIPFQQIQTLLNSGTTSKWQYLEAPLFSMRAMAKEVSLKEKQILPLIMKFLVQLPEHPKIRYSATLVLGRYTEWTSKNPEYLEPQLNYIIKGFELAGSNKDIVIAASHALMYFCQDCSELLINYLEQLYMLYSQIKDNIDLDSLYKLADGLAHVIKKVDVENRYKVADMFISPTLELLNNISLSQGNVENTETTIADQIEVVSNFISVLKCTDFEQQEDPIATLFIQKIWPLSSQLLSKYGKALIVSERILKLFKCAVQSFSTFLNPIILEIANILHQGLKTTEFGCYLWVSGVFIREFGDEYISEDIKESVFQFGLTQNATFCEIIGNKSDFNSLPDTIEDYFRMMNDLLMYFPFKLIPNSAVLSSTLDASVLTLNTIKEFEPLISCLHYVIDLVSWGMPTPPISFFDENPQYIQDLVKQFLVQDNNGAKILKVVLDGVIFNFHSDLQTDANDLLLKIILVTPDSNIALGWLSESVNSLPNVHGREVNKLLSTISVALPNKDMRRIRTSIKDFVSWYTRKNIKPRSEF